MPRAGGCGGDFADMGRGGAAPCFAGAHFGGRGTSHGFGEVVDVGQRVR